MANSFVLLDIVTADVMKGTILMISSKNWRLFEKAREMRIW